MNRIFAIILTLLTTVSFAQNRFPKIPGAENSSRIMSFNIRYDNPNDGNHSWAKRRDKVVDVIRFHKVEIIGIQEALYHQVRELEYYFPDFAWYGVGRDDGKEKGEFSCIFYDTTRYSLIEGSTFWLSETPEKIGSIGWDAALPRICTWVKLEDNKTQKSFYIFNCHLDHQGAVSRMKSANLIVKKVTEIAKEEPVVLMGDFNSYENAAAYQQITYWEEPDRMEDAIKLSIHGHHGPTCTFIGFDVNFDPRHRIDYIFIKNAVRVLHHAIIEDHWNGFYPSDHLPVLAEIIID
jgi:endonuclease/exonuclease/phosphatase family metal-dependent hydrolase